MSEEVWSARDCSPDAIEAALRQLLHLRYEQHEGYVPARVLNMVAIVDREWKGEIQNRLEGVGRYHASRTILVAVEPGRTTLDAWASLHSDVDLVAPGQLPDAADCEPHQRRRHHAEQRIRHLGREREALPGGHKNGQGDRDDRHQYWPRIRC